MKTIKHPEKIREHRKTKKPKGLKMYLNKTDFTDLCKYLEYLMTHNKNYTQKQWYALLAIEEILIDRGE